MIINRKKINDLLNEQKDNTFVENIIYKYFRNEVQPVILTENEIMVYIPQYEKYFLGNYRVEDNYLILENFKTVNLKFSDDEFKKLCEEVFEIYENDEDYEKTFEKLNNYIKSNKMHFKEEDYLELLKKETQRKISNLFKTNPQIIDNWKWDEKAEEYKERLRNLSPEIQKTLKQKWGEIKSEFNIPQFFDYLDITKAKFVKIEGKDLYKIMKLEIPKSIWINEEKLLDDEYKIKFEKDMEFSVDAIKDMERMLKDKKYVEEEEFDVRLKNKKISSLLNLASNLKMKENVENFWKNKNFLTCLKEVIEDKMEVESFVKKFSSLSLLKKNELDELIEKSLIALEYINYSEVKEVLVEVINSILDEEKYRDHYFSCVLGCKVNNSKELLNESDLGFFLKQRRYPQDFSMILVKNLIEWCQDFISSYRPKQEDYEKYKKTLNILTPLMFRLNEIWAKQYISKSDKKILKFIVEFLEEETEKIKETEDEIIKNKYDLMDKYEKSTEEIIKNGTIKLE